MRLEPGKRSGQTAVLFTLAIFPILGMLGLVVDAGWAYYRKECAQTAADAAAGAAALAAFQSAGGGGVTCGTPNVGCYTAEYTCPATLPTTPANNIQAGCMYARDNGFPSTGRKKVTLQSGVGIAPTSSGVTISYWVVARVTEQIPQLFSSVLGFPFLNVTARATTGTREGSAGGCVITLDPHASGAISMNGTTNLTSGCGVFDNSDAPDAINVVGGGTITTTGTAKTQVVGDWSGSGNINPPPQTHVLPEGDPFAEMDPPPVGACSGTNVNLGSHDTRHIGPGTYCYGFNLSAQSSLTLDPGVYVVRNGISLGAQTSMTGTGVTIYIQSGGVNMSGGATVGLTAPSSGQWQGILFYQDRHDTTASTLVGGTNQLMNGVLYFPAAHLNYTGGSGTSATATTIVANTLTLVGNSFIQAAATTQFTGISGGVILVE